MTQAPTNLSAYIYLWVSSLNYETKREILSLMNIIIKNTDTIGFRHPLLLQEGMEMLSYLDQEIQQGRKHLLLIKNYNNIIIGHVLLTQNSLPNCYHRAEISRAIIHPEYRSLSLVKKGLKHLLEKCEEIGISSLELDVRAPTSLSRLWQVIGFEVMGENPDYARCDGQVKKGVYMRQSVANLKKNI